MVISKPFGVLSDNVTATKQKLANDGTKNGPNEKHHHDKEEKNNAVKLGACRKEGHSTDSTDGAKPCSE